MQSLQQYEQELEASQALRTRAGLALLRTRNTLVILSNIAFLALIVAGIVGGCRYLVGR